MVPGADWLKASSCQLLTCWLIASISTAVIDADRIKSKIRFLSMVYV